MGRSPAPHTTINSIGREERRKGESSFVTVLYKPFTVKYS